MCVCLLSRQSKICVCEFALVYAVQQSSQWIRIFSLPLALALSSRWCSVLYKLSGKTLEFPLFLSFRTDFLLQLLEELLGLEVVRNGLVKPGDDFVDLLLPAGLWVLPIPDRGKELTQGCFNNWQEMIWNLEKKREKEKRYKEKYIDNLGQKKHWDGKEITWMVNGEW